MRSIHPQSKAAQQLPHIKSLILKHHKSLHSFAWFAGISNSTLYTIFNTKKHLPSIIIYNRIAAALGLPAYKPHYQKRSWHSKLSESPRAIKLLNSMRKNRMNASIPIKELSHLTGISHDTIVNIEQRRTWPKKGTFDILAKFFGWPSFDQLTKGEI